MGVGGESALNQLRSQLDLAEAKEDLGAGAIDGERDGLFLINEESAKFLQGAPGDDDLKRVGGRLGDVHVIDSESEAVGGRHGDTAIGDAQVDSGEDGPTFVSGGDEDGVFNGFA